MNPGPPATLASGLGLLEGPVWRPDTADLLVTVVGAGRILRIDPGTGDAERFADTAGGPNGAHPCADGGLLVTQNGGLDWDVIGIPVADPSAPTTPGLQRVHPDGAVELLTGDDGPFRAPNDLAVTADGTVYFTDPPAFPPPPEAVGRVWRWRRGERPEVYADGFTYCNGIGVAPDGTVLVVEGPGLLRVGPGGDRSWLVESLPNGGDGFAFDTDGIVYVAGGRCITIVSPEGRVEGELEAPEGPAMITNCAFGGDDLRSLYVTDGGSGRVLRFGPMPVPGVPLVPF